MAGRSAGEEFSGDADCSGGDDCSALSKSVGPFRRTRVAEADSPRASDGMKLVFDPRAWQSVMAPRPRTPLKLSRNRNDRPEAPGKRLLARWRRFPGAGRIAFHSRRRKARCATCSDLRQLRRRMSACPGRPVQVTARQYSGTSSGSDASGGTTAGAGGASSSRGPVLLRIPGGPSVSVPFAGGAVPIMST